MSQAGEQGSSLIEVLLALGLSLVALLAVAALFGHGMDQNLMAGRTTTEVFLAQEKLEELLTLGSSPASLVPGTYDETLAGGYPRTWTVVANEPAPNARTVVVRVFRPGTAEGRQTRMVGVRAQ